MQMRAGNPVPTPVPLHSLLQAPARLGVSILPPLMSPSHTFGSPKPVLPPGDILVTGHCCVPRAALTAHSLSVHLGGAVPLPCHPDPHSTGSGAREALLKPHPVRATPRPRDQGCPMELVTSPLLGTSGEKGYANVLGGRRPWEETGSACLVSVPTAGHCRAGTVLVLHGLGGQEPPELPELHPISSGDIYRPGSGKGRGQGGNILNLHLKRFLSC